MDSLTVEQVTDLLREQRIPEELLGILAGKSLPVSFVTVLSCQYKSECMRCNFSLVAM